LTRGGAAKLREEPERRCIVTGDSGPKGGLVRFVVGPDNAIWPDVTNRLPGRGIYVSADRTALDKAVARNLFLRAAKAQVTVAPDLTAQVEALLVHRVTDLISLSRKAGEAICGFEKVKDWLDKGRVRALIQASDGSERGKEKLWTPEGARFIGCLTAGELGLSFGRERAIHAALASGGLTQRIVEDAARLAGFRGQTGGKGRREGSKDA
jgi:uncharacterized protein